MVRPYTSQFEKQVLIMEKLQPRGGMGLSKIAANSDRAGIGTQVSLTMVYSLEMPPVLLSTSFWPLQKGGSCSTWPRKGRVGREQGGQPLMQPQASLCGCDGVHCRACLRVHLGAGRGSGQLS